MLKCFSIVTNSSAMVEIFVVYHCLLDQAIFWQIARMAIYRGRNLHINDNVHDFWKYGLRNFMAISEGGGLKRGGITSVHCTCLL